MRVISALVVGATLASCTAVPPQPPMRSAQAQQQYERLLAGKVAMAPLSCLPAFRGNDMIRIDDDTVVFREGARRVYVNHMRGPCAGLANSSNTLVTREFGGTGPCSGDIARIVDTTARIPVGSCAWGEFVPYVTPRA